MLHCWLTLQRSALRKCITDLTITGHGVDEFDPFTTDRCTMMVLRLRANAGHSGLMVERGIGIPKRFPEFFLRGDQSSPPIK